MIDPIDQQTVGAITLFVLLSVALLGAALAQTL